MNCHTRLEIHGDCNTSALIPLANVTHDIGTSDDQYKNVYATTFHGTATSANWSDLAERYESDKIYKAGTVLAIGGDKEVTLELCSMLSLISLGLKLVILDFSIKFFQL